MAPPDNTDHGLLLTRLLGPAGPELTCERCFDQLDRYVELELELTHDHAHQQVPGMREHLQGCPACDEDHKSLLTFIAETGRSPTELARTLASRW